MLSACTCVALLYVVCTRAVCTHVACVLCIMCSVCIHISSVICLLLYMISILNCWWWVLTCIVISHRSYVPCWWVVRLSWAPAPWLGVHTHSMCAQVALSPLTPGSSFCSAQIEIHNRYLPTHLRWSIVLMFGSEYTPLSMIVVCLPFTSLTGCTSQLGVESPWFPWGLQLSLALSWAWCFSNDARLWQ